MEPDEWRHLAYRLIGIGGPLLFLLIPIPSVAELDFFAGVTTFFYLSILNALIAGFWFASDLLLYKNWKLAFFKSFPIAICAFLASFLLFCLFSKILIHSSLTPWAIFGYRWCFLTLWGTISGLAIGCGIISMNLVKSLSLTCFLCSSVASLLYLVCLPGYQITGFWFIVIPLYIAMSLGDEYQKKAWLVEHLPDEKQTREWILYWDSTSLGYDLWNNIHLEGPEKILFRINRGDECYYIVDESDFPQTFLNHNRIRSHFLKDGDEITIDRFHFTFREKKSLEPEEFTNLAEADNNVCLE
ncbi:hypothetical protein ACFL35_15405 [Candidatus Riflebacteria bacterium]